MCQPVCQAVCHFSVCAFLNKMNFRYAGMFAESFRQFQKMSDIFSLSEIPNV